LLAGLVAELFVTGGCSPAAAPLLGFPRRGEPAGYPAVVREDGAVAMNPFPMISDDALARPFVGRKYAARTGWYVTACRGVDSNACDDRGPTSLVGPRERLWLVARDEVTVMRTEVDVQRRTENGVETVHRVVACVDIRKHFAEGDVPGSVLLDVQPRDGGPSVPVVLDAITGERLALDPFRVVDENDMPCDVRELRRRTWEEHLGRGHGPR
jgi:hypothetical protein